VQACLNRDDALQTNEVQATHRPVSTRLSSRLPSTVATAGDDLM